METIEIKQSPRDNSLLFGRSLFQVISGYKNESDFTNWASSRIERLALIENVDFFKYKAKVGHEQSKQYQYDFTLDAAMRLAKTAKVNKDEAVKFLQQIKLPTLEPTASLVESTQKMPELVSKHKPEQQTPIEAESIDTLKRSEPIDLPLTPTQQRLKAMQEQLEQLQKEVEEEAKQQVEKPSMPGTSEEILTMFDNRIDSVEGKVNVMLTFFEQASVALRGLATIGATAGNVVEEVAEPTTRVLLVRRVNSYAAATRQSEHETWKYLYGQMDLHLGFNAYAQPKVRDQSYLKVIEERGQIDALYDLAKKLLVLPALK